MNVINKDLSIMPDGVVYCVSSLVWYVEVSKRWIFYVENPSLENYLIIVLATENADYLNLGQNL